MSTDVCAKTDRESQVNEQLSALEKNVAILGEVYDRLHGRINRIVRSEPTNEETSEEVPNVVELADTLRQRNDSLNQTIYKFNNLIGRIEL